MLGLAMTMPACYDVMGDASETHAERGHVCVLRSTPTRRTGVGARATSRSELLTFAPEDLEPLGPMLASRPAVLDVRVQNVSVVLRLCSCLFSMDFPVIVRGLGANRPVAL